LRDNIKNEYCKSKGIKLIRIDYKKFKYKDLENKLKSLGIINNT
jgi:hypothetical protein